MNARCWRLRFRRRLAAEAPLWRAGSGSGSPSLQKRSWRALSLPAGGAGLLLDLPAQPLGPEEMPRAVRLFEELGVRLQTWDVKGKDGKLRQQSAFQLKLGTDTARAAQIAQRVLLEVYRLSPALSVDITEG